MRQAWQASAWAVWIAPKSPMIARRIEAEGRKVALMRKDCLENFVWFFLENPRVRGTKNKWNMFVRANRSLLSANVSIAIATFP